MLFVAEPRPASRWRAILVSVVGLLCVSAAGAWLPARLAGPDNTPALAAPPPTPLIESDPAAPESPVAAPKRPRPEVLDEERPPKVARRLQRLSIAKESDFTVTRRLLHAEADERISAAYAALVHGDAPAARGHYQQALAIDPENRQALLGLAATLTKQGEVAEAWRLYLRLVERDPADPLALAGLLDLQPPTDPRALEGRLKTLVSRHPGLPSLHAGLGSLYARGQQWPEARLAYARALELESAASHEKSPDAAFNLAVALDHLGERREALAHYRAALDWARRREPAFDPAVAEARVRALSEI